MADCSYTFKGPDGTFLTVTGIPGLKAYLVDGGLEHLFPERKFPLKAVASLSRKEEPATKKPADTYRNQAEAETHLREDFGPGVQNLIDKGILNFTQGTQPWPNSLQNQLLGGEEAVYYNGKAYIDLQATSKDRLSAVVLHELGEHYNLEVMLGARDYAALQNQITNRAKIKGSEAERTWNQVKALYPDLEVGSKQFISEVIAKLGEQNPKAPWYRRILARIKAFLVERGLGRGFITGTFTEEDMHALLRTSLMSASSRFAKGEARTYGKEAMASTTRLPMMPVLEEFTKDDEIFKHPVSDKNSLSEIMADVAPQFENPTRAAKILEKDGVKIQAFVAPSGNLIKVLESGNKVWIDVSSLTPGDSGGAIYAAVGNYAHNNGLKFVDDPEGVSRDAVIRRPGHMLSLALKFGSTDFLGVSDNFEKVSAKFNLPSLNWGSDFDTNIGNLIVRDLYNTYAALPELKEVSYDFRTNRFRRNDNGGVLPSFWARRFATSEAARSNRIGESSIRRAVFLESLASETGREKSEILGQLRANGRVAQRVPLKGIFSRAPEERSPLWNRWFGKSKMVRNGQPIKFYHGSQAEFTVFDKNRIATSTSHSTAGLGHFFTENPEEAYRYGGNVKEVFLSAQKPYITNSWMLDDKFSDAEGAAKFREKLQSEGYDSVYIKDAKYAVVFESNQAKLTANASPTFGEDVRFSRVQKEPWQMTSEEYETPTDLKPQQSFYVNAGGKTRIEIIRNPSSSDLNSLKKEAIADYGEPAPGDPSLRFTADAEGNKYYWKAAEGVHAIVEPAISRLEGVQVSQNEDYKPSHRMVVRRALYNGEPVPAAVLSEYPGLEEEVRAIPGNKLAEVEVQFSRIGTVAPNETYEEARLRDDSPSALRVFRQKLDESTDSVKKMLLAGLGVNHMIEIMAEALPTLKSLGRSIQLRETAKMDVIRDADKVVVDAKNNLSNAVRNKLNRVINESTDADVDASLEWRGIRSSEGKGSGVPIYTVHTQAKMGAGYKIAASDAARAAGAIASPTGNAFVRNQSTFRSREQAENFLAELEKIEAMQEADATLGKLKAENESRKSEHARLNPILAELGTEASRLYTEMNNQHTSVMTQQLERIIERIENAISDRRVRSEMIANTRKTFEDNSLQWYYAPLTRFGDYWFYGTLEENGETQHWREHAQSEKALAKKIALFEEKGGVIVGRGKMLQNIEQFGSVGVADSYIADIQKKISEHLDPNDKATLALQDAIYQLHLSSLPDVSIRHSKQHRKGVKGADTDAFKSFSDKMHHASTQLANMQYGAEIAETMDDHQEMKKLWENRNLLRRAEARVQAIDLLKNDWDTLAKPNVLERMAAAAKAANNMDDARLYDEAISVRNKFGGALRDQLDAKGNVIGQIGSESDDVQNGLERLKSRTEKHVTGAKHIQDKDKVLASDVIDELLLSVNAMMNTQTGDMDQLAMKISALNFTGMMGFGVSSALTNILQTPGVAAPVIGARYGLAKTMLTLNKTSLWFMKAVRNQMQDEDGNYSITGYLVAELEKARSHGNREKMDELNGLVNALEAFKKDGTISRTRTFDLLGVAEHGLGSESALYKIMKAGGFMFHHAERFNREVTLTAAYLLARKDTARVPRKEGESDAAYAKRLHEYAVEYAGWANERAHLNYSADVAARIFRGPLSRIALQFKKYTHGMMFLWAKAGHDMLAQVKRENYADEASFEAARAAKLEARRTFLGLLFMQTSFAGVMGLPAMGALSVAYGILAGDDDDVPADLERDLTAIMIDWFGEDAGYAIARGFIDKFTPVAMSSRLDLKDIMFREPLKELEGRDEAAHYALQLLGPTGGSFLNLWQGATDMAQGDVFKGAEKLLPKAIGDLAKAYRFAAEGATTRYGDHIKDMSAAEVFWQSIGYGSSELNRYYAESGFAKSAEFALSEKRRSITSTIGRAISKGDVADMDAVDEWNETHPEWPIRYQDLVASAKRIAKNEETRGEKGYLLNPKLEYLREEYDFFDDDDED